MPSKMSTDGAIAGMSMINFRLTIRRRLLLLFLLLVFFPLFAYRFALDLQYLLLNHQAQTQQQTVQQLALILQTRPDLWGQTLATQQTLPHLDLNSGSIWLVNRQGQTSYVMGYLNHGSERNVNGLEWLGQALIGGLSALFGQDSLPFPHNDQPEKQLIEQGLAHQSAQYYRTNHQGEPLSLMSSSPLYSEDKLIGVIIYEQTLDTIFNKTLGHFYYLVGLGTLLLMVFLSGITAYSTSLSKRILTLSDEVRALFNAKGELQQTGLFYEQGISRDEISELRLQIDNMLQKLTQYDRYLKQLPKTLRHELHNPINRMSLALEQIENQHPTFDLTALKNGLDQLKHIISSLSEAYSFEQALSKSMLTCTDLLPRLVRFFKQVEQSLPPGLVVVENNIKAGIKVPVWADAFMLEQLFDKLLDNALDFNDGSEPIRVRLHIEQNYLCIDISNSGPNLPKGFEKQVFEGMISIREKQDQKTHLGLGLYVASLIAAAHNAHLTAKNRTDNQGVVFSLALPIVNKKAD